ncbi:MAG TPA: LysE family translocator [Oceanospirillaceae bacterium]|nr:LysE family translocator [Oceanospirillaceae bacterium]
MIDLAVFPIFLITTFVVILSPGPAAISVTGLAAGNGFLHSLWMTLGIALGNVVFFVLSATGIAALIVASTGLFTVIKWAGVAYLVYLSGSALLSKGGVLKLQPKNRAKSPWKSLMAGFGLELANPKALMYFAALLPQFLDLQSALIPQLLVLGTIVFILDICCYSLYGYLGSKSTAFMKKPNIVKWINRSAGTMLLFSAARVAFIEA